jgi:hypothetical protein
MTNNKLPIHITGMENIKGQQSINSILDSMNNEIDNHKWIVTTQNYANLKFEKYLESGSTLTVDQKPKTNIPVVGTHNNRKVYIGDLDVQGNLVVKDLALRDNVNTVAKSWEVRSSGEGGSLKGDWWNSESFQVGIRNPLALIEVESVPNDIQDPVYGDTIYNKITYTAAGQTLDTKTFEKTETSYYISYPYIETTGSYGSESSIFLLEKWQSDGWKSIGSQTYFPQITTLNAKACWAPGQYYGVFDWENGSSGRCRLVSYATYPNYDDFYAKVASYPDTQGKNGRGIMIPSWRAIEDWYDVSCAMSGVKVVTRRFISEEFDGRNSGIVKVDISFRV